MHAKYPIPGNQPPLPPGWPGYTAANALRGLLIYAGGDTLAALILGEFSLIRLLAVAVTGATLYALEAPNWFHLIDRIAPPRPGWRTGLARTALALAYFNPLWIARHLAILALAGGGLGALDAGLFVTAGWAFAVNIPLALGANFLIQNAMPASWRFTASALFSALMAVYYAMSTAWFG